MRKFQITMILGSILLLGFTAYFAFPIINQINTPKITLETQAGDEKYAQGLIINGNYQFTGSRKDDEYRYAQLHGSFALDTNTQQVDFLTQTQTPFKNAFVTQWKNPSFYRGFNYFDFQAQSDIWNVIIEYGKIPNEVDLRVQNRETADIKDFTVALSTNENKIVGFQLFQVYVYDSYIYILAQGNLQQNNMESFTTALIQVDIQKQTVVRIIPLLDPKQKSWSFSQPVMKRTTLEPQADKGTNYATRYLTAFAYLPEQENLGKILSIDLATLSIQSIEMNELLPYGKKLYVTDRWSNAWTRIDENIAYIYLNQRLFVFDFTQNRLLQDFPIDVAAESFQISEKQLAVLGKENQQDANQKLAIYDLNTGKQLYLGNLSASDTKQVYHVSISNLDLQIK